MIQANELRCGNYAMANNTKYRPDDVGKTVFIVGVDSLRNFKDHQSTANIYLLDDVFKDTYGTWLVYLEPIPITEEWLLKCGFKPCNMNYRFILGIFTYNVGSGWFFGNKKIRKQIHVHQFQNTYFSLTGEELTISVT